MLLSLIAIVRELLTALGRLVVGLPGLPARRRDARRNAAMAAADADERRRADQAASDQAEADRLAAVGRSAVVVRALKRNGVIDLDGVEHEAVSDAGFVEAGTTVRVVAWDGRRFTVTVET